MAKSCRSKVATLPKTRTRILIVLNSNTNWKPANVNISRDRPHATGARNKFTRRVGLGSLSSLFSRKVVIACTIQFMFRYSGCRRYLNMKGLVVCHATSSPRTSFCLLRNRQQLSASLVSYSTMHAFRLVELNCTVPFLRTQL